MKKSDQTMAKFAEALRELAEAKPIDKITVGEICAGVGKAPATFYRHFRDKYDLAAWDYARTVRDIMSRIGRGDYRWRNTLLDGLGASQIPDLDAFVLAYCAGTVRLACEWITGRIDCSPERLAQIMEECLPRPLRAVLLGFETRESA